MAKINSRVVLISVLIAALVWFADSLLDFIVFYRNGTFADFLLFNLSAPELFMRMLLTIIVISAGIVIGWLLNKQLLSDTHLQQNRENMRKYSYAIEQSPSVVVITDTEGNIEYVNPKFTQITGYSFAEVKGKNPRILKSGMLSAADYKQMWDTITTGREWRGHFHNKKKNGELYWEAASVSSIKNEAGKITHFLAVKEDITEQIQTEQALRASEERFHQVVESISDHIYVTEVTATGDYRNVYISPHVEALSGYQCQQFVQDWEFWSRQVIHPDDRPMAKQQFDRLIAGQNSQSEYRLVRADGTILWVRDSARVNQEHEGLLIYGVVSDITNRKRTEEQIKTLNDELEQRVKDRTRELSALYEVTAVGSQLLNLETMLARSLERSLSAINTKEGYIHLLDSTGEQLELAARQKPGPIVASDMLPEASVCDLAGQILQHSEPLLVPDIEAHFNKAPTGNYAYAGVPIRASGQTIGVLSIVRFANDQFSIEETALLASIADQVGVMVENARLRRQAEQTAVMQERERLARELHDSVTQSLYSLTLLTGGGQRMARAGTLDNVETYLADLGDIAQQSLKEMRLLVHELRPTVLEQAGLIGALQQRLDAVEGRSGVETRLLVETSLDAPARVEEGLYRIALEALNNALKHAAATRITVRVFSEQDDWVLEITDNGTGFNPHALIDTGGMGLISVHERAAQLGGTVTINSSPEAGTTVQTRIAKGSADGAGGVPPLSSPRRTPGMKPPEQGFIGE